MRADMDKLIVERPRRGGGKHAVRANRRKSRQDPENTPAIRGLKKLHVIRFDREQKWLIENLNPLFRYLNKQAGRPWNKVFAEICERISVRSPVQAHIREHIEDIVATHVTMIGRRPYARWPAWGA